jgi:hypothetical protein
VPGHVAVDGQAGMGWDGMGKKRLLGDGTPLGWGE